MSDWVETVFVGPGVERTEVEVTDDFPVDDHVIKLDGIGASPEESFSRLEPGHQFERLDELTHRLVFLLETFPFALPHDDHTVTLSEHGVFLGNGGLVNIAHAQIAHLVPLFVAVRVTLGTTMPETTVKFVHGVRVLIVPVYVEGLCTVQDHVFASIASVLNVATGFLVQVRHPFESREGMGFTLRVPSLNGFGGQGIFGHVMGTVEEIARRGDGETSF